MLFQLHGSIYWTAGYARSKSIDEEFDVLDGPDAETMAVEEARRIIRDLNDANFRLRYYSLRAALRRVGTDMEAIWETSVNLDRFGTPERPVQLADCRFREKLLIKPRSMVGRFFSRLANRRH